MPSEQRDVVVFLGPSLPLATARSLLDAEYLPPVQQGNVYEVACNRPRAIVIIDGYFGWVPAVWHKEILWALDQGIRVFGASSMGALRAAELHPFGMIGHGLVFRDYLEERIADDDEVAIVHASAEEEFRPLSDAMVNIRHTLHDAACAEVIAATSAAALIDFFKGTFFPRRQLRASLAGLSADARQSFIPPQELARLESWLPSHQRDVKREDAESVLRRVAADGESHSDPKRRSFAFQPTVNWLHLAESVREQQRAAKNLPAAVFGGSDAFGADDLLTECRLEGSWPAIEAMALARLLVSNGHAHTGPITEDEYLSEMARLSLILGAETVQALESWLADTGWESDQLARIVEREALLGRAREYWIHDLRETAIEMVVLTRCDSRLLERARRKRAWLDATGGRGAALHLDPAIALQWFRARIGISAAEPDHVLASRHGWSSVPDMIEDVTCDYHFSCQSGGGSVADQ